MAGGQGPRGLQPTGQFGLIGLQLCAAGHGAGGTQDDDRLGVGVGQFGIGCDCAVVKGDRAQECRHLEGAPCHDADQQALLCGQIRVRQQGQAVHFGFHDHATGVIGNLGHNLVLPVETVIQTAVGFMGPDSGPVGAKQAGFQTQAVAACAQSRREGISLRWGDGVLCGLQPVDAAEPPVQVGGDRMGQFFDLGTGVGKGGAGDGQCGKAGFDLRVDAVRTRSQTIWVARPDGDGAGDVFERALACGLEQGRQRAVEAGIDGVGYHDATGRGDAFEAGGDVDAFAVDIMFVAGDITDVNAHAQGKVPVGLQPVLYQHGGVDGGHGA